jgi:hypothetical protein
MDAEPAISIASFWGDAATSAFWEAIAWAIAQGILLTFLVAVSSIVFEFLIVMMGARSDETAINGWRNYALETLRALLGGCIISAFVLFVTFFIKTAPQQLIAERNRTVTLEQKIVSWKAYRYHNEMTVAEIFLAADTLTTLIAQNTPFRFTITYHSDAEAFYHDFYDILVKSCQKANFACEGQRPRSIDGIPITKESFSGIRIHQYDKSRDDNFAELFDALLPFVVHRSFEFNESIIRLIPPETKRFYWFELGDGRPFKR